MKKLMTVAAMAVTLASGASADPVDGVWRSQPTDDGAYITVTMGECGANICGTIRSVHGGGDNSIAGKRIIWNMQPRGGGEYRGGKIWAPDQDKTYNSRMTLSGNTLRVSGCVLGICRSQNWTRQ